MSHNPTTLGSFLTGKPNRNRGALSLAAALGQRLKAALHQWQRGRAARTLQELDDWTLNDIGLTRSEIRSFVGDVLVPAPRQLSPATSDERLHTSGVKENRYHLDAYLSWRDL